MNRRDFLATLLAIGGAAVIPFKTIEAASEVAIDLAWAALQREPKLFYVNDWGVLSTLPGVEGVHMDVCRGELFRLGIVPESAAELTQYISTNSCLEGQIETCFDYSDVKYEDDCPYENWEDWLAADGYPEIRQAVEDWLAGMPDDNDYTSANFYGLSGHGDALYFFKERQEISEILKIHSSDTANPASFEFVARMDMNIETANSLLAAHGIPILFEEGLS